MLARDFLKATLFIVILIFVQTSSFGFPPCNNSTEQAVGGDMIYGHFWLIFGSILFIFSFYTFITMMICYFSPFLFYPGKRIGYLEEGRRKLLEMQWILFSAMILAAGLFGFLHGIIFNQILQWHSMVSNTLPLDTVDNFKFDMFWNGIFHLFSLGIMLCGMILVAKVFKNVSAVKLNRPLLNRYFLGAILLGGGIFSFIEGVMNHQFLALHHVVQRSLGREQFYFDMLFLLMAVALIVMGIFIIRKKSVAW